MSQLTSNTLKEIKKNRALVRALEDLHERHPHTMQMWLRYKQQNPRLCTNDSINTILAYLKTDIDSILEKTEADFPQVV
jgi:hypothetical protein